MQRIVTILCCLLIMMVLIDLAEDGRIGAQATNYNLTASDMSDGDDVEVYNEISVDDNGVIKADIYHYLHLCNVLISANSLYNLFLGQLRLVRMIFIAESVDHKYIITRNYAGGLPS
jgi:hypothetical protein